MCLLDGGQAWGWTRHTHTHIHLFSTKTQSSAGNSFSELTFLIVTLRRNWLTAAFSPLCFNPLLGAHAFLPKVVRFWYLWRLASETQLLWHLSISPLSKQVPGLLYLARMSSHTRDNIQNQTLFEFILMHRMDSITLDQISKATIVHYGWGELVRLPKPTAWPIPFYYSWNI